MAACSQQMYDSVYGKNAAHRNKTLTDLPVKTKALDTAKANMDKVNADPKSSAADKKAATDKAIAAYNDYKKTYDAYRNLPEEADAWRTGNAVGNLLKH
jgi:hypothetical protein